MKKSIVHRSNATHSISLDLTPGEVDAAAKAVARARLGHELGNKYQPLTEGSISPSARTVAQNSVALVTASFPVRACKSPYNYDPLNRPIALYACVSGSAGAGYTMHTKWCLSPSHPRRKMAAILKQRGSLEGLRVVILPVVGETLYTANFEG